MEEIKRVDPREAYDLAKSGAALLVCAYDNDDTYRTMRLAGAISFGKFQAKEPTLSKDSQLIFFCG